MTDTKFALLAARAPLSVAGADARPFLQGLVSNDMDLVAPGRAVYAALLTAQGKFLHEFFVFERESGLLLDAEAARLEDLTRRLKLYKLRAKVEVTPLADHAIAAIWGEGAEGAVAAVPGAAPDPRLTAAGARAILPAATARETLAKAGFTEATESDYDRHRLGLGLPDGSRDMEVDKAVLLECGFEELHGVDFQKGCYMGQELTARTKYRGLVKKRLMPVAIEGEAPSPGTPITFEGREAGEMRSGSGNAGMALVRLDAFDAARLAGVPLMAGDTPLSPWEPDWMTRPEKSA